MQMGHPINGDLVLVGGGHAQISVLKAFAMKKVPGLRLTLVTNSSRTPYSGMLPGYVEGVWQDEDLHIDLRHLAAAANARMIVATVNGIDADLKQIYLAPFWQCTQKLFQYLLLKIAQGLYLFHYLHLFEMPEEQQCSKSHLANLMR